MNYRVVIIGPRGGVIKCRTFFCPSAIDAIKLANKVLEPNQSIGDVCRIDKRKEAASVCDQIYDALNYGDGRLGVDWDQPQHKALMFRIGCIMRWTS